MHKISTYNGFVSIHKVSNLFTEQELTILNDLIDEALRENAVPDERLGRVKANIDMPNHIKIKLSQLVNDLFDSSLIVSSVLFVEYSGEYGNPNLPPHFDGDNTDAIIDFQLSSNTSWPLGTNLEIHDLMDNSALIFNPNTNTHWRPFKTFNKGEYVKMIFIRFVDPVNMSDYSHMRYGPDDQIFKEINNFRNSLMIRMSYCDTTI